MKKIKNYISILIVLVFVVSGVTFPRASANASGNALLNCIADTYGITNTSRIEIHYQIPAANGVVTRFNIYSDDDDDVDVSFPDSGLYEWMNTYVLCDACYPEPMLFLHNENRLTKLHTAYLSGMVSEPEMKQLAQNAQACVYFTGDVNRDKRVSVHDVTALQKIQAQMIFGNELSMIGDVDGNHTLDMKDVTLLQRYLAEFVSDFSGKTE